MIIDSHAHLDYPQLADDLPAILARAHEAGEQPVARPEVESAPTGSEEEHVVKAFEEAR